MAKKYTQEKILYFAFSPGGFNISPPDTTTGTDLGRSMEKFVNDGLLKMVDREAKTEFYRCTLQGYLELLGHQLRYAKENNKQGKVTSLSNTIQELKSKTDIQYRKAHVATSTELEKWISSNNRQPIQEQQNQAVTEHQTPAEKAISNTAAGRSPVSLQAEKVLFFASQKGDDGYHLEYREMERGTDQSKIVMSALHNGWLLNHPDKKDHYVLTLSGYEQLLQHQISFKESSMPPKPSELEHKRLTAIKNSSLSETQKQTMKFDPLFVQEQVKRLENMRSAPTDTTWQEDATDSAYRLALLQLAVEGGHPHLLGDPGIFDDGKFTGPARKALDDLLAFSAIEEIIRDDLGVYYGVTDSGVLLFEQWVKQKTGARLAPGQKLADLDSNSSTELVLKMLIEKQSMDAYRNEVMALAERTIGPDLSHINTDLSVDEGYNEDLSAEQLVKQWADISPEPLKKKMEGLAMMREEASRLIQNGTVDVISELKSFCKSSLLFPVDDSLLDHAWKSALHDSKSMAQQDDVIKPAFRMR